MFNYRDSYKTFKKLPWIAFWINLVPFILLGLIDLVEMFTDGFFIIFPLIGVVLGLFGKFITAVVISPVVIITDLKLEEAKKG